MEKGLGSRNAASTETVSVQRASDICSSADVLVLVRQHHSRDVTLEVGRAPQRSVTHQHKTIICKTFTFNWTLHCARRSANVQGRRCCTCVWRRASVLRDVLCVHVCVWGSAQGALLGGRNAPRDRRVRCALLSAVIHARESGANQLMLTMVM